MRWQLKNLSSALFGDQDNERNQQRAVGTSYRQSPFHPCRERMADCLSLTDLSLALFMSIQRFRVKMGSGFRGQGFCYRMNGIPKLCLPKSQRTNSTWDQRYANPETKSSRFSSGPAICRFLKASRVCPSSVMWWETGELLHPRTVNPLGVKLFKFLKGNWGSWPQSEGPRWNRQTVVQYAQHAHLRKTGTLTSRGQKICIHVA